MQTILVGHYVCLLGKDRDRQAWQIPILFGRDSIHKKNRKIVSVRSYYFVRIIKKNNAGTKKTQILMLISNPLKSYKKDYLKKVRGSRTFEHRIKI